MKGRKGRDKGSTQETKRRFAAVVRQFEAGFRRKEAERLVACYEQLPNCPCSAAYGYAVRKSGRPLDSRGPKVTDIDGNDPEAILLAKEEAKHANSEVGSDSCEADSMKLRRLTASVRKAVTNFRFRLRSSGPSYRGTVPGVDVTGGVRSGDVPHQGRLFRIWTAPEWPWYDQRVLGDPCVCDLPLRDGTSVSAGRTPKAPSAPHRHCRRCGLVAPEGDPVIRPVIRYHPVSLTAKFYGWACQECVDEVLKSFPPPWDSIPWSPLT